MSSPYLDRLLAAAMKRHALDALALQVLMKATHLWGLALAARLRKYRDCRDPIVDRFAQLQEQVLHVSLLRERSTSSGPGGTGSPSARDPTAPLRTACASSA